MAKVVRQPFNKLRLSAVGIGKLLGGKTTRRVRQLALDGVIPKPVGGKYLVEASVVGYILWRDGKLEGVASTKVEHEIALSGEKVEAAKIANEKTRGELVNRDAVRVRWLALVSMVKTRILGVHGKVAAAAQSGKRTPKAIAALVRKLNEEALQELADYDGKPVKAKSRRRPPDGVVVPAKKRNGKRVGRRKPSVKSRDRGGAGAVAD